MEDVSRALEALRLWRLRRDGSVYEPEDKAGEEQLQRDGFLDPRSNPTDKTIDLLIHMKPSSRGGFTKKAHN